MLISTDGRFTTLSSLMTKALTLAAYCSQRSRSRESAIGQQFRPERPLDLRHSQSIDLGS